MYEQNLAGSPAMSAPRIVRIEFSGSGSEYFRIWIVNLLLTVLTLGLYLPFAKARRLRYFYSNTRIGEQALAFHGKPWKMFRGFVLLVLLALAYALSGHFSPTAGLAAFVILAAIWPALWRASLQFRLANTSWRGLRLGFGGDLAGAYLALLPSTLPALGMILISGLHVEELRSGNAGTAATAIALCALASLLLLPLTLALCKRYQQTHCSLAEQRSRLDAGIGSFYWLALKFLLWCLAYGLLAALFVIALARLAEDHRWLTLAALALAYLGMLALVWPFLTVRLQNLVWGRTSSQALRFESNLRLREYAWLSLKNWCLTLLTLGLYRPFAAVASARLRLEAVSLRIDDELDSWVARQQQSQGDAAGDAAGDFFGIDMGL
jgi:uncharacterized membrane protein YjgN (DUF898 family)